MNGAALSTTDAMINFNWGEGPLTTHAKDHVSVRWFGKLKPTASEAHTFYVNADDGVRVFFDQREAVSCWAGCGGAQRFTRHLSVSMFYDLRVEYREGMGSAHVSLQYSTPSTPRQIVPSSMLFYTEHIVGSPYALDVVPGAADYPFTRATGAGLRSATAGSAATFTVEARDASNNVRSTDNELEDPNDVIEVSVTSLDDENVVVAASVLYTGSGQYAVEYTALKAGRYKVSVRTGGMDIYCGLGATSPCSPFDLTVSPGPVSAATSEAESTVGAMDHLLEAAAGDVAEFSIQAKDVYGNNAAIGGAAFRFVARNNEDGDLSYTGKLIDNDDGTYRITYTIPTAGSYTVAVTLEDDDVRYCAKGRSALPLHAPERSFRGASVYAPPTSCGTDRPTLRVVHGPLYAPSSTVAAGPPYARLTAAETGIESGLLISARDEFENLRSGEGTTNFAGYGNGKSDVFLATIEGPRGYTVLASSAVTLLTIDAASADQVFALKLGSETSVSMRGNISAEGMQAALSRMFSGAMRTRVSLEGHRTWRIEVLSHLEEYGASSLPGAFEVLAPAGFSRTVEREARGGVYPVRYTLHYAGTYSMSITSAGVHVDGSPFSISVSEGRPDGSAAVANFGAGLSSGVAGVQTSLTVQARDARQLSVQAVQTEAVVVRDMPEILTVQLDGNPIVVRFLGKTTAEVPMGGDLEGAIEALFDGVDVDVDGVVSAKSNLTIAFASPKGNLAVDVLQGASSVSAVNGETAHRHEVQALRCSAPASTAPVLEYGGAIIDGATTPAELEVALSAQVAVRVVSDATSLCDTGVGGNVFHVEFIGQPGNVGGLAPLHADGGSVEVLDTLDGVHPLHGTFTLAFGGAETAPIPFNAGHERVRSALETLPSISPGDVEVAREPLGYGKVPSLLDSSLAPTAAASGHAWLVTFLKCSSSACPADASDTPLLSANSGALDNAVDRIQMPVKPVVTVTPVRQATSGNDVPADIALVDLSLVLEGSGAPAVGVGKHEVHRIRCSLAGAPGEDFHLSFGDSEASVPSSWTGEQLAAFLSSHSGFPHVSLESRPPSARICSARTAWTDLRFSAAGAHPRFESSNAAVSSEKRIAGYDAITDLGGGLVEVKFTPTVKGRYRVAVAYDGESIYTPFPGPFVVQPASVSAVQTTHTLSAVATSGVREVFSVQARDRFGNSLDGPLGKGARVFATVSAAPHPCNDQGLDAETLVTSTTTGVVTDGRYTFAYTPLLAGNSTVDVVVETSGGLTATYYRSSGLTDPVIGNAVHKAAPYHEPAWCPEGAAAAARCPGTRIDRTIEFDWSAASPLPGEAGFPEEHFSVAWRGEVMAPTSGDLRFVARVGGSIKVTVGTQAIISQEDAASEALSGIFEGAEEGRLYPIRIEYASRGGAARLTLSWAYAGEESPVPVPASALWHRRHVSGSPHAVTVYPGAVNATSTVSGGGAVSCVAREECSFTIHAKDAYGNLRFHDAAEDFLISMEGASGWALSGRLNDDLTRSSAWTVGEDDIVVSKLGWEPMGTADVAPGFPRIANFSRSAELERGSVVFVGGERHAVDMAAAFGDRSAPLSTAYTGTFAGRSPTVAVFRGDACSTGQHLVTYRPSVKGAYRLHVKTASVKQRTRIRTSAGRGYDLSGRIGLSMVGSGGKRANVDVAFDAPAAEVQQAIEAATGAGVQVYTEGSDACIDATTTCSWIITLDESFAFLADTTFLGGSGAAVSVEDVQAFVPEIDVVGSPFTVEVAAAGADAALSTAFGVGLVSGVAGKASKFYIQPKDSWGNDVKDAASHFRVLAFASGDGGLGGSVASGAVEPVGSGLYSATFTPTRSAVYNVIVVLATAPEEQEIVLHFGSSRDGTFRLRYASYGTTVGLSVESEPSEMEEALKDLGLGTTRVTKSLSEAGTQVAVGITYTSFVGTVPLPVVLTEGLVGLATVPEPKRVAAGTCRHIKGADEERKRALDRDGAPYANGILQSETQTVRLSRTGGDPASFRMAFLGAETDDLPWNVTGAVLQAKLNSLTTVGAVSVLRSDVDGAAADYEVRFLPSSGCTTAHLLNYGDLPDFTFPNLRHVTATVRARTDGAAPFAAVVEPGALSAPHSIATDGPDEGRNGLTRGFYSHENSFKISARDRFGNPLAPVPVNEIQIIEVVSTSRLEGTLKVSYRGDTVDVAAEAAADVFEAQIRKLSGIGRVSVSTGDDGTAGANHAERRYAVTFESNQGDVPSLSVSPATSTATSVNVFACQAFVSQRIILRAQPQRMLGGALTLAMGEDVTADLAVRSSETAVKSGIEEAFSGVHEVTVARSITLTGITWDISFVSYDEGALSALYAEGKRVTGLAGQARVLPAECPVAAGGIAPVAGAAGPVFYAQITGPRSVSAKVVHTRANEYTATYVAPPAGSYSLHVSEAHGGGLAAEYFNNRWMHGAPAVTRVDPFIDFAWSEAEPLTPTGLDYISIRWTGYVQPLFSEIYTFTITCDDGARLFVGGTLLIDRFDERAGDEVNVFTGTTTGALAADVLVPISVEYRENTGAAQISVAWSSSSQPLGLIPSERLFHSLTGVGDSPFGVDIAAVEPTAPRALTLSIATHDSINVAFDAPDDDGGSPITAYSVEWWEGPSLGQHEVQTIKIAAAATGTYFIRMAGHGVASNPWKLDAAAHWTDVEKAIEFLPNVGDVEVTYTAPATPFDQHIYRVEFLSEITGLAPLTVAGLDDSSDAVVCRAESADCASDDFQLGALPAAVASSEAVSLDVGAAGRYTFTIADLEPSRESYGGYSVRVRARRGDVYGPPCPPLSLRPFGVPDAPARAELLRAGGSGSSLRAYWTDVTWPENRGARVTGFQVQWSVSEDFPEAATVLHEGAKDAFRGLRRPVSGAAGGEAMEVYEYTIDGLLPGTPYFVRIASRNAAGVGAPSKTAPASAVPMAAPAAVDVGQVVLGTIRADESVSVDYASTSLQLSWAAAAADNGAAITSYVVEYGPAEPRPEIQCVQIAGSGVAGTFRLAYADEATDHLPCDVGAAKLEAAIQSLSGIRHARVEARNGGRAWLVTFLSESPTADGDILRIDASGLIGHTAAEVGAALEANRPGTKGLEDFVVTSGVMRALPRSALAAGDWVKVDGAYHQVEGISSAHVITFADPAAATFADGTYPVTFGSTVAGTRPADWRSITVAADGSATYELAITGLTTGVPIVARVSAVNARGGAPPTWSAPKALAPPVQRPGAPQGVGIHLDTASSLRVVFHQPSSSGGDGVTKYRIEWDTSEAFRSSGGAALGHHDFGVANAATDCLHRPCSFTIPGLSKGTPYYVRVFAYNSHGFSAAAGTPDPLAQAPKTQPAPPARVDVSPAASDALTVAFPASADDGGAAVVHYRVEWTLMDAERGTTAFYAPHDVQSITTSADGQGAPDSFRVSHRGRATEPIGATATAAELEAALESLDTVGDVAVSRSANGSGYVWLITFLYNFELGGNGRVGRTSALAVSASPTALASSFASHATFGGRNATVAVRSEVVRYHGLVQRAVRITAEGAATLSGILSGTFVLTLAGETTAPIDVAGGAAALEVRLEELLSVGDVDVFRKAEIIGGHDLTVTYIVVFLADLGAVGELSVDASGIECGTGFCAGDVQTISAGTLVPSEDPSWALVDASAAREDGTFRLRIAGLEKGKSYHVRVAAYNGIGGVYGPAMYSTPVLATPCSAPQAASQVAMSPVGPDVARISWRPPLDTGGHPITRYKVEWDGQAGAKESQTITIGGSSPLSGTFTLTVGGATTRPLAHDASERAVAIALEGLSKVGAVSVSRATLGPYSSSWRIDFLSNVGDLPRLVVNTGGLRGVDISASVTEVDGVEPAFAQGSIGVRAAPLHVVDVIGQLEVQRVTVEARANDLSGYFKLGFMGETTLPISAHADGREVKVALEALGTVRSVDVASQAIFHSTVPPLSGAGIAFSVTFTDARIAHPLLSASYDSGLLGTGARVHVEPVQKGGLPTEIIAMASAAQASAYVARVSAYNGFFWSPTSRTELEYYPAAATPEAPREVAASALSDTAIGVGWSAPARDGGESISSFLVQWSTSASFATTSSAEVQAGGRVGPFAHEISGLAPSTLYFVRVSARNSKGHGPYATAEAGVASWEVRSFEVRATAAGDVPDPDDSFRLRLTVGDKTSESGDISLRASASDLQATLKALPNVEGHEILVTRDDHSSNPDGADPNSDPLDGTGIDTQPFRAIFFVTFSSALEKLGALEIVAAVDGPEILAARVVAPACAATGGAVRTRASSALPPPSAPTNVQLFVVSKSELGVSWEAPLLTGGSPIVKYLIEWGTSSTMTQGASPERVAVMKAFTHVSTVAGAGPGPTYRHQIQGLPAGSGPYFVRVRAYNGHAYSEPRASAPQSAAPAHALPYKPTNAEVRADASVAPSNVAERLFLRFQQPTVDANGFDTATRSGSAAEPDVATHYVLTYSTEADFAPTATRILEIPMYEGSHGGRRACEAPCEMEIGAEVQRIVLGSSAGGTIDGVEFKAIYLGPQSANKPTAVVTHGSKRVELSSGSLAAGDYVKIEGRAYKVAAASGSTVTLTAKVGAPTGAYKIFAETAPAVCLSHDASAEDVRLSLEASSALGPGDVEVNVGAKLPSRREWFVTFSGAGMQALQADGTTISVDDILLVSQLTPDLAPGCGGEPASFSTDGRRATSVELQSAALVDAGAFVPGTRYYMTIAAKNSVGTGAARDLGSVVPRSPPGAPTNARVFGVAYSAASLRVTWEPPLVDYGDPVTAYRVRWRTTSGVDPGEHVSPAGGPGDGPFEYTIRDLTPGASYLVSLRAVNGQGESRPAWDGSGSDEPATPTCAVPGCTEPSGGAPLAIKARALPGPPCLDAAQSPSLEASKEIFSASTATVSLSIPGALNASGDDVVLFKIEHDTDAAFSNPVVAHVPLAMASRTAHTLSPLATGETYHVRAAARTSAGYGPYTPSVRVKPMRLPDAPSKVEVATLGAAYSDKDRGTMLSVTWTPPAVDATGLVGSGGDAVSAYFVEWSLKDWSLYRREVQVVRLACSNATGALGGTFRLSLDTSGAGSGRLVLPGSYTTGRLRPAASEAEVQRALENLPGVGTVSVSRVATSGGYDWSVTFDTEVGDVPEMTVQAEATCTHGSVAAAVNPSGSGTDGALAAYGYPRAARVSADILAYTVPNLVAGRSYYVRVSSCNALGCGARRVAAPYPALVPLRKPGTPTYIDQVLAAPSATLLSSTSIAVRYGPPAFDGGDAILSFVVQWDTASTFDSGAGGTPLGSRLLPATSEVCASCVTAFTRDEALGHYLSYDGDASALRRLRPGRRVLVRMDTDGRDADFTFEVASAGGALELSAGAIPVEPSGHSRLEGWNGSGAAALRIVGGQFIIDGLKPGGTYFVRLAASTGAQGQGAFTATVPPSITVNGAPGAASSVFATASDTTSLDVSWTLPPPPVGYPLTAVRVERFTDPGKNEVQRLWIDRARVRDGSLFRLEVGDFVVDLPGTVDVASGEATLTTGADLSALLRRGDVIDVAGVRCTVSAHGSLTPRSVPLAAPFAGRTVIGATAKMTPKTPSLPCDITAAALEGALEALPSVGQVSVARAGSGRDSPAELNYLITFDSSAGDVPTMTLRQDEVIGAQAMAVMTEVDGASPKDYAAHALPANSTSVRLSGLTTGQPYFVRVVAENALGGGASAGLPDSTAMPTGAPLAPSSVAVESLAATRLLVSFTEDADGNGLAVPEYVITWDAAADFSEDPESRTVPATFDVQRITARARTPASGMEGSFKLSVGDYRGGFSAQVGGEIDGRRTFVRVGHGEAVAIRENPDEAAGIGAARLQASVVPGEVVHVGGQAFAVCQNFEEDFLAGHGMDISDERIPLCQEDDPHAAAAFDGGPAQLSVRFAPMFRLAMSLGGAFEPSLGATNLRPRAFEHRTSAPAALDLSEALGPGDLLRVGHPIAGETFRVRTSGTLDAQNLPLGSASNASEPASLGAAALAHATYEVQRIRLVGTKLAAGTAHPSGYRIRFGAQVSSTTQSGGREGCILWDADAATVEAELETLPGVDDVKVSRKELVEGGHDYLVTFVGAAVRGSQPDLVPIDIGVNGCTDFRAAGDLDTPGSGQVAAATTVVEHSYVPLYKAESTADIPYTASADDMKALLEELSAVCSADVTRETTRSGRSWLVTFARAQDGPRSGCLGPCAPVANANKLFVASDGAGFAVEVVGYGEVAIPVPRQGVPYFVKVRGKSSYGVGVAKASAPLSAQASPTKPGPPAQVDAEVISSTEVFVQWAAPRRDGGDAVAYYLLEYDISSVFDSGAGDATAAGSVTVPADAAGGTRDVQAVTVSTADGEFLGGTFALSVDGKRTAQIAHDASAADLRAALEQLCAVGSISVSRHLRCSLEPERALSPSNSCDDPQGYTWLITFDEERSMQSAYASAHQRRTGHRLSGDGAHLLSCNDATRVSCRADGTAKLATPFVGSAQELVFRATTAGFKLTFMGVQTRQLMMGQASTKALKAELERASQAWAL